MAVLKIVIADDHRLILHAVRESIEAVDDMEIVGEADSGAAVLPLVERTRPDVVLLDVRMPGMDGLACLERIRKRHPRIDVVMFSGCCEDEQIRAAFRRGAAAYIVKSVNPADLPAAIRQAHEHTVYHPLGAGHDAPGETELPELTDRELAVLKAVARGLSNRAISKEFWVTEQTVKFHLGNIYRKLGVPNRTAAARHAHQHGLVETFVGSA